MMNKMKKGAGFTLIELLVVIAIIGLLSTLSLVALNVARQKARDALRTADVKQMMTALELEYNDKGVYPNAVVMGGQISSGTTVYMGSVPTNPIPVVDGWCSTTNAGVGVEFKYYNDGAGASYHITYCLAGGSGGINRGPHIATPNGIANP
jgi:prepilin-type N-terminal cleavage/methylation domain-containing protein